MEKEKLTLESLAKETAKIKVNKNLHRSSIVDAPFFKEKMKRAKEILSVTGLPRGY